MSNKWIELIFTKYDFKNKVFLEMSDLFKKQLQNRLFEYFTQQGINMEEVSEIFLVSHAGAFEDYNSKLHIHIGVRDWAYASGVITWKSKNGADIKPYTENVGLEDIDFEINTDDLTIVKEKLKIALTEKFNLRIKPLNYELIVKFFYIDSASLFLYFKDITQVDNNSRIINSLSNWINEWNEESEKKKRRNGIIHDGYVIEIHQDYVIYYIDFGSAEMKGLKYILKKLDSLTNISRVIIKS